MDEMNLNGESLAKAHNSVLINAFSAFIYSLVLLCLCAGMYVCLFVCVCALENHNVIKIHVAVKYKRIE